MADSGESQKQRYCYNQRCWLVVFLLCRIFTNLLNRLYMGNTRPVTDKYLPRYGAAVCFGVSRAPFCCGRSAGHVFERLNENNNVRSTTNKLPVYLQSGEQHYFRFCVRWRHTQVYHQNVTCQYVNLTGLITHNSKADYMYTVFLVTVGTWQGLLSRENK